MQKMLEYEDRPLCCRRCLNTRTDPSADPLICPTCSREMRIIALIDERAVIERILRHLGLWTEGVRLNAARAPPAGEGTVELFPGDPLPDYSREPVMDYDLCANG